MKITKRELKQMINEAVNQKINETNSIKNSKVQKKIKELMSQLNDFNTMYEILENAPADGLTIWEAMEVFNAIENICYDSKHYLDVGEKNYRDITPYQYNQRN